MRFLLLAVSILLFSYCFSQSTYYVQPNETDAGYAFSQDSHAVTLPGIPEVNKLFLFIGGTNSNTSQYIALRNFAANLGYHVINLSYPNDVAAASLSGSSDNLAFDNFRQEICYGTPLSSAVSVDTLNSIYTRTLRLIQHLSTNQPGENWGQFLQSSNAIDWSKVITGGHSQGSGHASYLSKQYPVERVLMFSGPNDYSDFFAGGANWLGSPGTTSTGRHFVYLSLYDEVVDFSKQFTNIETIGMLDNDDTTLVDISSPPYGNSHCLYTKQSPGFVLLNHNTPVKNSIINDAVWEYMLSTPLIAGITENDSPEIIVYPNPTSQSLFIESSEQISEWTIYALNGQILLSGDYLPEEISLNYLPTGSYIIELKGNSSSYRKMLIKK